MIGRAIAAVLSGPLLLATLLAVAELLLRGSRRRMGSRLIAAAALIAYLASTSLVGNALLGPLERAYPAFIPSQALGVRDIVVLGSSYEPDDRIPVTGALDGAGLARIVEGVRLAHARQILGCCCRAAHRRDSCGAPRVTRSWRPTSGSSDRRCW